MKMDNAERVRLMDAILRYASKPVAREVLAGLGDDELVQHFERVMDEARSRRGRRAPRAPAGAVQMTHAGVVEMAAAWLPSQYPGAITITGAGSDRERPDVIGFARGMPTVLVEAKVSLADLISDETKEHRAFGGFGELRWYAFPAALGDPRERSKAAARVCDGWGIVLFRDARPTSAEIIAEPQRREESSAEMALRHMQERDVLIKALAAARADISLLRRARAARLVGGRCAAS